MCAVMVRKLHFLVVAEHELSGQREDEIDELRK
jgi:hypothetical protein